MSKFFDLDFLSFFYLVDFIFEKEVNVVLQLTFRIKRFKSSESLNPLFVKLFKLRL